MLKHLLTITTFLFLAVACKKDDDDDNTPSPSDITKENLSGTYAFISATGKANGIPEQDITNDTRFIPTCKKDDILTLRPDLTFTSTDAGVTCSTNGSFSGVWSIANDSTLILNSTEVFTIKQFDGTTLKLGYKADVPLFGNVDVTSTFKKQ
jgi:hypothetical protein